MFPSVSPSLLMPENQQMMTTHLGVQSCLGLWPACHSCTALSTTKSLKVCWLARFILSDKIVACLAFDVTGTYTKWIFVHAVDVEMSLDFIGLCQKVLALYIVEFLLCLVTACQAVIL